MTKRRSTKSALISSVLALVLCCSMLLGTTFAWFTDSVTSANNIIKTGTLNVEMYWSEGKDAPTDDAWKDASKGAIFNNTLWEPGYTEARHLKIANEGSLALKYQLAIIPNGDVSELADVIDVYYQSPAKQISADRQNLGTKVGTLADVIRTGIRDGALTARTAYTATIVLKMQESAGNEYQDKSIGTSFSIQLIATQMASENDSFGPDYDENAWAEGMVVHTANDLQAALNNGVTNIKLVNDIVLTEAIEIPAPATTTYSRAIDYTVIDLNGKSITIDSAYNDAAFTASSAIVNNGNVILTGKGTVKASNNYTVRNYGNMIIDGITVENGIMNFADLTVESGNISNSRSGKHTIYGNGATLTINGGTFYNGNPGNAAIFSYAGEVEINGGEFSIADGTATLGWTSCLLDAQGNAKFTINGGTINGEIRDYNKNTTVLGGSFTHGSVKNFVATGFKSVQKGDFYYVVSDTVDAVIATADELLALGGKSIEGTYYIGADINLNGAAMPTIGAAYGKELTILGNGHTISNATTAHTNHNGMKHHGFFFAYTDSTLNISDLTFENITIDATKDTERNYGAAIVVAFTDGGSNVVLNNVDVHNSTVLNNTPDIGDEAGVFVGYQTGTLTMTNCDSTGCKVAGETAEKTGAFFGMINGTATLTNCTTDLTIGFCNRIGGKLIVDGATIALNATVLAETLKNGGNVFMQGDINTVSSNTAPYGNKYAFELNGGVLDGNGHELYMECFGDDYGVMTTGGTIKNVTITEGCRAIMIMYASEDIIIDNVNIGGDGVLYTINTGEYAVVEGVDLIVTNSTLAGWTSYAGIASATFTNVKFEQGTYYNNIYGRVFKPYVTTTLTDCEFVEHMNLDLSGLQEGQKVTIVNCTVNGQAVTAETFTIPTANEDYDTALFTVDLPSWADSIEDCIIFG